MTTATTAVVGVVLQLHGTSRIDSHFADLPGAPTGTLQLGELDGSGVTVVFDSADAVERAFDELAHLRHAFASADRRLQEDLAWAEHDRVVLTDRGRATVGRTLQLVRS